MSHLIPYSPITHAHIKPVLHPRLGVEIDGRSAVRYLRFLRPVRVERLELPPLMPGFDWTEPTFETYTVHRWGRGRFWSRQRVPFLGRPDHRL